MDPVTIVAAAVAAGTSKSAVAEAYRALKSIIARKYPSVDVAVVQPEVPARRAVLAGELAEAGADSDDELLSAAKHLLGVIAEQTPQAAEMPRQQPPHHRQRA